jgi:hypothetical protein
MIVLVQEHAAQWSAKLKPLDMDVRCCKRECVSKTIPRPVQHGIRSQFEKLGNQLQRKKAIQSFLDAKSATSFSFCYGQFVVCWKALSFITGVSSTLLQSVTGSPKARFEEECLYGCTHKELLESKENVMRRCTGTLQPQKGLYVWGYQLTD